MSCENEIKSVKVVQNKKEKEKEEDSPLKQLSWLPDMKFAIEDWQRSMEEAQRKVDHHKKAIKSTKVYIKEIEENRPQLFAQILADPKQVIEAYTDRRPPFTSVERKQIYEHHNRMLIQTLTPDSVHRLKDYVWSMESFMKNDDWEFLVQTLIDFGDLEKIKTFLECRFDRFPKKIRQKLVEYIESRSLAEYMAEPQ